ncbi:hypothetical protein [Shewanella abyssi]|nr:hypothetical protein [Shewanella abyssi]
MSAVTIVYVEHSDVVEDARLQATNINFVKIDGYKDFFRQKKKPR